MNQLFFLLGFLSSILILLLFIEYYSNSFFKELKIFIEFFILYKFFNKSYNSIVSKFLDSEIKESYIYYLNNKPTFYLFYLKVVEKELLKRKITYSKILEESNSFQNFIKTKSGLEIDHLITYITNNN